MSTYYGGYERNAFGDNLWDIIMCIVALIFLLGIVYLAIISLPMTETPCSEYTNVPLNSVPLRCVKGDK